MNMFSLEIEVCKSAQRNGKIAEPQIQSRKPMQEKSEEKKKSTANLTGQIRLFGTNTNIKKDFNFHGAQRRTCRR